MNDGGSRSFHQQAQRERLTLLQAIEEGRQVRMGRRGPKAFEALKESLTTPPIMTPPIPKETLLLYISSTTNVVSTVLVTE
jgi:hypothetical protein